MKGFLRAGHTPTLIAALLYFDVSFMAWVLLGPLAPFLRADLGLTATEQGLGRWTQRWDVTAVQHAGIYSYRAAMAGADDESPA